MNKNVPFFMVVAGILIVLMLLFLYFGYLKHQREKELALNSGRDEQARQIRDEAEEYRIKNTNQQFGILAVALVIVPVAVLWRLGQRKQEPE